MAVLAAAALVSAGIGVAGAINSSQEKNKAKRHLNAWEKSHAQDFKTGQQIYLEAEQSTPYGYTPAETANFQQGMARRSNQARRVATDRNPNLSGAVNAAINYGNIQGLLGFASQDAQLKRNLISEKVGLIRGQSNAQTQFNQNVSAQYGQAIQQQKENLTNSLYNVANSAAAYGYYSGGTGGGGNKTIGTSGGINSTAGGLGKATGGFTNPTASQPNVVQSFAPYRNTQGVPYETPAPMKQAYSQDTWMRNPGFYNPYDY